MMGTFESTVEKAEGAKSQLLPNDFSGNLQQARRVHVQEDDSFLFCSFCGKRNAEVKVLIAGPTVFICDECVELCRDIVGEKRMQMPEAPK